MSFRAGDFLSRRRNLRRAGAGAVQEDHEEQADAEAQENTGEDIGEDAQETTREVTSENNFMKEDDDMGEDFNMNSAERQGSYSESSMENAVSKKVESDIVDNGAEDRPLTAEDVRGIVSHELSMASVKTQMLQYFDDIAASSNRTETMINDMRKAIDDSLEKISVAAANSVSPEQLEQIDEAVRDVAKMSENLEGTLHKDNLISYQNTKSLLDDINKKLDGITKKNNSIDARIAQTDDSIKESGGKLKMVIYAAAGLSGLSFIATIINLIASL